MKLAEIEGDLIKRNFEYNKKKFKYFWLKISDNIALKDTKRKFKGGKIQFSMVLAGSDLEIDFKNKSHATIFEIF